MTITKDEVLELYKTLCRSYAHKPSTKLINDIDVLEDYIVYTMKINYEELEEIKVEILKK